MSHVIASSLVIGLVAAGIFLLVAMLGLGFFFLFLPIVPLLWAGLSRAPRLALGGAIVAAVMVSVIGGAPTAILFLLMIGLPGWYISKKAILFRDNGEARLWYPLGAIWAELTLFACLFLFGLQLFYTSQSINLEAMLAAKIHEAFAQAGPEYAEVVNALANQAFLLFSMGIWLWGLSIYGLAWFTNRRLVQKNRAIRPGFAMEIFAMPNVILLLLAATAFLSLFGTGSIGFIAKALLLSLFMPYFFLGAALMHATAKPWPNRKFFLFFIYLLVFTQFWPALGLAGIGVFHHIKRLSGPISSSRS